MSLLLSEYGVDAFNWLSLRLVQESPIPQDVGTKFGIACLLFATGKSLEQSHAHAREIAERDAKNAKDLEKFRASLKDDVSREVVRLFQDVPPVATLQHVLGRSGNTPEAQGFLAEFARILNAQPESMKPVALKLLSAPLQLWAQDLQLVTHGEGVAVPEGLSLGVYATLLRGCREYLYFDPVWYSSIGQWSDAYLDFLNDVRGHVQGRHGPQGTATWVILGSKPLADQDANQIQWMLRLLGGAGFRIGYREIGCLKNDRERRFFAGQILSVFDRDISLTQSARTNWHDLPVQDLTVRCVDPMRLDSLKVIMDPSKIQWLGPAEPTAVSSPAASHPAAQLRGPSTATGNEEPRVSFGDRSST